MNRSFSCLFSKLFSGLSLFLLTLLIYLKTLAPGVYGFDSAELATGVFTQGIVHPPGYPLYLLIGKLFTFLPFGDVAYRLNLMSAFFASLTVMLLYQVIVNIFENRFAAWVSAFLFAISNYFWQMALIAEVYAPFTAFLAGDMLALYLWHKTGHRKYLLVFSFLYGLTLTMHTSGILFAPAFIWLILSAPQWKRSYWQLVSAMFPLFLAGLTPISYLSLRERQPGDRLFAYLLWDRSDHSIRFVVDGLWQGVCIFCLWLQLAGNTGRGTAFRFLSLAELLRDWRDSGYCRYSPLMA